MKGEGEGENPPQKNHELVEGLELNVRDGDDDCLLAGFDLDLVGADDLEGLEFCLEFCWSARLEVEQSLSNSSIHLGGPLPCPNDLLHRRQHSLECLFECSFFFLFCSWMRRKCEKGEKEGP